MTLPRKPIVLLPETLINQIAAGEVVERPASVVKELVENSLDADARQIIVECEQAGSQLIRVRDDGSGIPRAQLGLALTRHATSKLSALADLQTLLTMGFRGEALPSIASIARVSLTSRAAEAEDGPAWQVRADGLTTPTAATPTAHPPGTTVEVRDIFFNAPPRRRFLKSERTEFWHIEERIKQLALAHPHVALRLVHNHHDVLQLNVAADERGQQIRVQKICGSGFMQHARVVAAQADTLQLCGWLVDAANARNQTDLQYLFVNQRAIRDAKLQHAIRLAYQDSLAAGRYPAYVLYLTLPPDELDVNVHPAKTEVRFQDNRRVHDFVLSALRTALADSSPAGTYAPQLTARRLVSEPAPPYHHTTTAQTFARLPQTAASGECLLAGGYLLTVRAGELIVHDVSAAITAYFNMCFTRAVTATPLLFPTTLPVTATQRAVLLPQIDPLAAWGVNIHLRDAPVPTAVLLALPSFCREVDAAKFLPRLLEPAAACRDAQLLAAALAGSVPVAAAETARRWLDKSSAALPEVARQWRRVLSAAELAQLFAR